MCVSVSFHHDIEALQSRALSDDVFQSVREHVARSSVLEHRSCHTIVLRVVKHSVSIEEEVTILIRQRWVRGRQI